MESETPPEGAAAHRIADQRTLEQAAQQHVADRTSSTDPDGIVQAIARRDGTVSLHMTCGDTQTTGWLDASRAAQLCTGIWAVNHAAAMDADDTCTIGRHIRRVRHARDKSLRVIAELAGMNKSAQHGVTTAAVARSTSVRRPGWPDRSRV